MTHLDNTAYPDKCGDQMKVETLLACIATTASLTVSLQSDGWRGIVPLRSSRTQVEQVLGRFGTRCKCYSTETETVRVKYASGPCKGDLAGWNVPQGTVLSLQIYPKNPMSFSEMRVAKEEFVKTVDDATFTHYGNGEKGLRYSVSWDGTLESIWYGPSVKDNNLRCAGFPPTDGGVTAYTPYHEFPYKTVDDIKSRIGDFGIRLVEDRKFKGYVIVYRTGDKKTNPIARLMTTTKKYLIRKLNVDARAVEVIDGGFRERPTVELFLIPRDWPPPVPTPTLGGFLKR